MYLYSLYYHYYALWYLKIIKILYIMTNHILDICRKNMDFRTKLKILFNLGEYFCAICTCQSDYVLLCKALKKLNICLTFLKPLQGARGVQPLEDKKVYLYAYKNVKHW